MQLSAAAEYLLYFKLRQYLVRRARRIYKINVSLYMALTRTEWKNLQPGNPNPVESSIFKFHPLPWSRPTPAEQKADISPLIRGDNSLLYQLYVDWTSEESSENVFLKPTMAK